MSALLPGSRSLAPGRLAAQPAHSLNQNAGRPRAAATLALFLATSLAVAGCAPALVRLAGSPRPTATPAPTATGEAAAVATPRPNPNAQPLAFLPTPDWPVPGGHFYTQTNGQPPRASPTGFAVSDGDGIPFWSEYRRLGGPASVGYPLSRRFTLDQRVTQVFQRAVLQWNAEARQVQPLNTLLALDEAGKGDWLVREQKVPPRLPAGFDQGKSWDRLVKDRLALLAASPALQARYQSAPDPLALYGLPDSQMADQGDHQAIRLQRGVLRLWKQDRPWARAGEVTVENAGELAVKAGLFPTEALVTEQPSVLPAGADLRAAPAGAAPGPAATPPATSAPAPAATAGEYTQTPAAATLWRVANTGGDGVYLRRTPKLADRLRAWPDGTLLRAQGERAQGDGLEWHKVRAPDGSVGWVPAKYVVPAG